MNNGRFANALSYGAFTPATLLFSYECEISSKPLRLAMDEGDDVFECRVQQRHRPLCRIVPQMRPSNSAYSWRDFNDVDIISNAGQNTPDSPWQRFPSMLARAWRQQQTMSMPSTRRSFRVRATTSNSSRSGMTQMLATSHDPAASWSGSTHKTLHCAPVKRSLSCHSMSERRICVTLAPIAQLRVRFTGSGMYL